MWNWSSLLQNRQATTAQVALGWALSSLFSLWAVEGHFLHLSWGPGVLMRLAF